MSKKQVYKNLLMLNAAKLAGMSLDLYNELVSKGYNPNVSYDPLEGGLGLMTQTPALIRSNAGTRGFGESLYDQIGAGYNTEEFEHLNELRSRNLGALDAIANAVTKGAALAGTTFADGTIGLLAGIGAMVQDDLHKWSNLWNNDVSNTLHDINEMMEDNFQTYLSEEYQRNEARGEWYKNMGTVNWWAENVIKNAGFMVGAYYSGAAWSKLLAGLGKTIQAIKAGNAVTTSVGNALLSGLARSMFGVFSSAVNEGRIEANNNSADAFNTYSRKLEQQYNIEKEAIVENPYYTLAEKEQKVAELTEARLYRLAELEENRKNMGTADMFMNLPILMITEAIAWGKAFAGGSRASIRANVLGKGTQHVADNTSKVMMTLKGLGRGVSEGFEEINQAAVSNVAGEAYMWKDTPDTWNRALVDRQSTLETANAINALIDGFKNTYGKSESWLEFVAGAIPGLGGLITIGRSNNMSDETLGQGNFIGITGGFIGSILGDIRLNRRNEEHAAYMNNYFAKRDKLASDLSRSFHFNKGMEISSFNGDEFEFKNHEDNDFFTAIQIFNGAGRLSELQEVMTDPLRAALEDDKVLEEFIKSTVNPTTRTSPYIEGFSAKDDAELLSKVASVLGDLKKKDKVKERLQKRIKEIEKQIDTFANYREYLTNKYPTLSDNHLDELTWLMWKGSRFQDRAKELSLEHKKQYEEAAKGFKKLLKEQEDLLNEYIDINKNRAEENFKLDKTYEDLNLSVKNIKAIIDLFEDLVNNDFDMLAFIISLKKDVQALISSKLIDEAVENSAYIDEVGVTEIKESLNELLKLTEINQLFRKRLNKYLSTDTAASTKAERDKAVLEIQEKMDKDKEEIQQEEEVAELVEIELKNQEEIQKIDSYEKAKEAVLKHIKDRDWLKEAKATNHYVDLFILNANLFNNGGYYVSDLMTSKLMNSKDDKAINDRDMAYKLISKALESSKSVDEALDINNPVYHDVNNIGDYRHKEKGQPSSAEDTLLILLNEVKKVADKIKEDRVKSKKATPKSNPNLPKGKKADEKPVTKKDDNVAGTKNAGLKTFITPSKATLKLINKALDTFFKKATDAQKKYKNNIIKAAQAALKSKQDKANKDKFDWDNIIKEYCEKNKIAINPAWNLNKTLEEKPIEEEHPDKITYPGDDDTIYHRNPDREYVKSKLDSDTSELPSATLNNFLRPNTTLYAMFITKDKDGNKQLIPYSQTLPEGSAKNELLARELAMESYGVYDFLNNGGIKVGDKIYFTVDHELSEKLDKPVVLMMVDTKSGTQIVGDIPTNKSNYPGLELLEQSIVDEWLKAGKPERGWKATPTTTVALTLIGRAPFISEWNTIKDIKGGKDSKIKYGVVRLGNIETGDSSLNKQVRAPLNMTEGTPVIILPNVNLGRLNGYIAVPIYVPNFDPNSSTFTDTLLGRSILSKIEAVASATTYAELRKAVGYLKEDLYLKGYDIYLTDVNNKRIKLNSTEKGIKLHISRVDSKNKWEQVGDVDINDASTLASYLQGTTIRLNKDSMNGEDAELYDEIFETNLPKNTKSSINNSFIANPITEGKKEGKADTLESHVTSTTERHILIDKKYKVSLDKDTYFLVTDLNGREITDEKLKLFCLIHAYIEAEYALKGKKPVIDRKTKHTIYSTPYGKWDATDNKVLGETKKGAPITSFEPVGEDPDDFTPAGGGKPIGGVLTGTDGTNFGFEGFKKDDKINTPKGVLTVTKFMKLANGKFRIFGVNEKGDSFGFGEDLKSLISLVSLPELEALPKEELAKNILLAVKSWLSTFKGSDIVGGAIVSDWLDKIDSFANNEPSLIMSGEVFSELRLAFVKEVDGVDNFYDIANGKNYSPKLQSQLPTPTLLELIDALEKEIEGLREGISPYILRESSDPLWKTIGANWSAYSDAWEEYKNTPEDKRTMEEGSPNVRMLLKEPRSITVMTHLDNAKLEINSKELLLNELRSKLSQTPAATPTGTLGGTLNTRKKSTTARGGKDKLRKALYDRQFTKADIDAELDKLSKMLPLLAGFILRRKGLIDGKAWGTYVDGIITLSESAASGTTYHEAFHAVVDLLLTDSEKKAMFNAAKELFGNLDEEELEEKLAEDFREYVLYEEGTIGRLRSLWRKLKHAIDSLLGKEDVLNTLFYNINRGYYASKPLSIDAERLDKIRTYHANKYNYANLSLELKKYLFDNGINARLYSSMTLKDKETLFYCM